MSKSDVIGLNKDRQFRIKFDEVIAINSSLKEGETFTRFVHLAIMELCSKRKKNGNSMFGQALIPLVKGGFYG